MHQAIIDQQQDLLQLFTLYLGPIDAEKQDLRCINLASYEADRVLLLSLLMIIIIFNVTLVVHYF